MNAAEKIQFLEDILAIESDHGNEKAVADRIRQELEAAGIASEEVEYAEGRNNLVATLGEGERVLGFTGHLDVVPPGEMAGWATRPFVPIEKNGKIYGRGASDMKSGLAAMVLALIELKQSNAIPDGQIKLLATVGEETGLLGAGQLTKLGFASDVEALIVGEPTDKNIVYAHKGIIDYTVTAQGKSAHSSLPETGLNAIDLLLRFYNAMMDAFGKFTQENPVLGRFTYSNSMISGGIQANVVPDKASFTANLRTIPEISNHHLIDVLENVVQEINRQVPEGSLALTVDQDNPPVFSDPESHLVRLARQEMKYVYKVDANIAGVPGATDAAEFIKGNKDMQIIVLGPGNTTLHQVNEYVDTEDFLTMCEVYKAIAEQYFL